MEVAQGDVWWADLGDPVGSTAGYSRPVVVVQHDSINKSRLTSIVCIPLTSNTGWKMVPWNRPLSARATGLDKDSVAQTNLIMTLDEAQLIERVGRISAQQLGRLFEGVDLVFGRAG
jgi:mRNA interferase MazF